ncbi:MAG: VOC family protein [Gammaproteobacteria bacterium]|nr:VOC family protein [Gammaproteobacteria bacterium]
MRIDRLDHLVLTVASIEASCDFYSSVLGMDVSRFAEGRTALTFGRQKINLHEVGKEFVPRAAHATAGSGDLCLVSAIPLDDVVRHLNECEIAIIEGPVAKTGATGPIRSVYFRDPDGNLIEVSEYLEQ